MVKENEPRYVISVAARMVGVQVHTLRYYERMGLIEPARSKGKVRLYSEKDIERMGRIRSATEMGINLAGIEVLLRLMEHVVALQSELEDFRRRVNQGDEEDRSQ